MSILEATPPVAIVTPCTGVCTIDDDLCLGCARTLDEIAAWGRMTAADRDAVMAILPTRRGGQAAAAIAASSSAAAR